MTVLVDLPNVKPFSAERRKRMMEARFPNACGYELTKVLGAGYWFDGACGLILPERSRPKVAEAPRDGFRPWETVRRIFAEAGELARKSRAVLTLKPCPNVYCLHAVDDSDRVAFFSAEYVRTVKGFHPRAHLVMVEPCQGRFWLLWLDHGKPVAVLSDIPIAD